MTIHCKAIIEPLACNASFAALSDVVSRMAAPAILGGNGSVQGQSIFTAEPVEVFEFSLSDENPFEKLSAFLSEYTLAADSGRHLFCGGWIGYFGYELGRFIEKLPGRAADDLGFPVIRLAFYDKAIVYDHAAAHWYITMLDGEGLPQTAAQKRVVLKDWISRAEETAVPQPPAADLYSEAIEDLQCNMTRQRYFDAIAKTKRYIYDGDTYQINFSQRFAAGFSGRPVDLFHWQNAWNPCPYAAYLAWDDKAVISASPELFLEVRANRIKTCPIKGTRSRNAALPDEAVENQAHLRDLLSSPKDRAELAMIVDLERNDLARLCIPGTRKVTCDSQVMTLPSVYHTVAAVEGTLRSEPGPRRLVEILKATFPGGSITGAPKIRSMEIIDELEPTARGVYTGSIGWIGPDGNLCLNIAIRTILTASDRAYVQSGGGIVADSDAQSEWEETQTKARSLLAGIRAVKKGGG